MKVLFAAHTNGMDDARIQTYIENQQTSASPKTRKMAKKYYALLNE
jgi:hypothetical protein